jgi:hypothetical protein
MAWRLSPEIFLNKGNAVTDAAPVVTEHRRALGVFDRIGLARGQRRERLFGEPKQRGGPPATSDGGGAGVISGTGVPPC